MKKSFLFILVGVLTVLSLTVASYIVFTRFSPDLEIRRMMITMAELSSVRQDSGLSWTRTEKNGRMNTTLYTTGQLHLNDDGEMEHQTVFRVVHIGKGDEYSDLSGELRRLGSTTYLTYNPPGPEVSGVSFEDEQTWVSFEEDEFLSWGSVLPGLDLPLEWPEKQALWTTEGIGRLRYLLAFADIFVSEYNGLTEIIHEQNTRIIDANFDDYAIEAFLNDLVRAKEGREPNEAERILAAKQAKQLSRLTMRFWVGIKDHYLYRVQAAGGFTQEGSTSLIPVDIHVEFEDFNQSFEVTEPTDVLSFDEVLQAVFNTLPDAEDTHGFVEDQTVLVADETARLPVLQIEEVEDMDEDELDATLERFYGTDPNNPDTDGDGKEDGEEVRAGENPRGRGSLFGFGLDR